LPLFVLASLVSLALVGGLATPVMAQTDPIYYVDCSAPGTDPGTYLLTVVTPAAGTRCASSGTDPGPYLLVATGSAGSTYLVGSVSNGAVYLSGIALGVSGTYTLVDETTGGNTIASGSFSGTTTGEGCSPSNQLAASGSGVDGTSVTSTDTLQLTLSFDTPVTVCTGSDGFSQFTPTQVSVPVPEFGSLAPLFVVSLLAILVIRRSRTPA